MIFFVCSVSVKNTIGRTGKNNEAKKQKQKQKKNVLAYKNQINTNTA